MNLRPYPTLHQVLVTTKTDRTFRGILWRRRGGYLVLRQAALLLKGAKTLLDGELVIPMENVDFMQVVR